MASWLVRSTPERAIRVRALAGDIVLCSWATHFTLRNRDKLRPDGPLGSYADSTLDLVSTPMALKTRD